MKTINKIFDGLSNVFRYISGAIIVFMMLITSIDVILRLAFNDGFIFTVELMGICLMLVIYFAMLPTQMSNNHLHVTMLALLFPKKLRYFLWGLFELASAVICAYMAVQAFSICERHATMNLVPITLGWPQAPFEYVANVALIVFAVGQLLCAVKTFIAIFNEDYQEEVDEFIH